MIKDFDQILAKAGDFGLYQWVMYFVLCIPATLPSAWPTYNQVFVAAVPNHRCRNPVSGSSMNSSDILDGVNNSYGSRLVSFRPIGQCKQELISHYYNHSYMNSNYNVNLHMNYSATPAVIKVTITDCDTYEFDHTNYDSTIATDFNLVCDMAYWPTLSTTIFFVGSLIGNFIFGYIADMWGRRASFFMILTLQVIFGTASAFSQNIYTFVALRFIVGLTYPALYQIPFIIGVELMAPSKRLFSGMLIGMIYAIALCLLAVMASYIRSWSLLTFISNAPFVVLFSYWWILPESPRWLLGEGRLDEVVRQIITIAKWNKKIIDPIVIREECELLYYKKIHPDDNDDVIEVKIADLFKRRKMRKNFILISFIWFINAVVYNGLTLNVSNLDGNDYLSFFINGAVEIPAILICWAVLDKFGRRWSLCISMLIGGAACISTMFIPTNQKWTISGLAFAGKFGITASFAVIYIFAGELYPTVIRATGMCTSSMISSIGVLLAPFLISLGNYAQILPLLIMGALTIVGGALSLFLPETTDAPLLQTIEEVESFKSTRKVFWFQKPKTRANINLKPDPKMPLGMAVVQENENDKLINKC